MSGKHTTKTEMHGDTARHGPRADAKRLSNKVRRSIDRVVPLTEAKLLQWEANASGEDEPDEGSSLCTRCRAEYPACGGLCAECIEDADRLFDPLLDDVDLTEAELLEWEETGDLPASVLERARRLKMSVTIADVYTTIDHRGRKVT
jgi:hypothetical protein